MQNPLTGAREIGFVSLEQQISMGEQQYRPAQQMQGGQYQVDPALTDYVAAVGQRLAAVSGVDLPYEFVVLNNSVPNAWALPGGKLAVNRGLLTELSNEAELAAVLGHEIAHAVGRHGAKAVERGVVSQVVLLGVVIGAGDTEYAGTALGAAQLAAGLLNQKYGRDAEREADYYGTRFMARAGYDPHGAVTLQQTFLRLSDGESPSWIDGLFASHPASAERLANNRALVSELEAEGFVDGEFGADAYQAALRPLRADKAAYDAYDQARSAMQDERLDDASRLLGEAIAAQNREAAFHGLRGDLRLSQKRFEDAEINYDRAIERNDGYFAYYLGRGVARARQGQPDAAQADLERSLKLLPTASAYAELGRLAESRDDVDSAVRYYLTAGQSSSATGRWAQVRALALDVPRRPEQYVDALLSRDSSGRQLLQVRNRTPVVLAQVDVLVEVLDRAGQVRRLERRVAGLDPGAVRLVLVSEQPLEVADARTTVVHAEVAR